MTGLVFNKSIRSRNNMWHDSLARIWHTFNGFLLTTQGYLDFFLGGEELGSPFFFFLIAVPIRHGLYPPPAPCLTFTAIYMGPTILNCLWWGPIILYKGPSILNCLWWWLIILYIGRSIWIVCGEDLLFYIRVRLFWIVCGEDLLFCI